MKKLYDGVQRFCAAHPRFGIPNLMRVIVIGNAFVMVMEGMIVAIQIIRLEFYEIFSRFYSGSGKPFEPVKAEFSTEIE